MANPNPLPAAIHERRGTLRPDRHAKSRLPVAVPDMPKGLSGAGQAVWRTITAKLEAAGLIADVDDLTLRLLVDSVCLYDQASRAIGGKLTITTSKGNEIQNPSIGVRNKAWTQILKVAQLFGMSPSARTGLPCGPGDAHEDDTSDVCFKVVE